jgi:molybdopterin molybdotransferase
MLSISEAFARVCEVAGPLPPVRSGLLNALGLRLAEAVAADRDSPPFDKALMDGYAVRAADVAAGTARLRVTGEVTAGRVWPGMVGAGEAVRTMTGAPVPTGADAIVPVELTRSENGGNEGRFAPRANGDTPTSEFVVVDGCEGWTPGRHVLRRGSSACAGSVVLEMGVRLAPRHLGVLAELGRSDVLVHRRPRIGILATGDELVPVGAVPGSGQIRNSNETMLAAQVARMGGEPVPLGIAKDSRDELSARIAEGLACDVLLLSGGVSAGLLDLVPSCLAEAGVREVFHKVRLKPGQPLWFGVREASDTPASASRCVVFGLPGNPVSSLVCCELFVFAAVARMTGRGNPLPTEISARLEAPFTHRGNRPTYHPARLSRGVEDSTQTPVVETVAWSGSADLCATVGANALAIFEAGDKDYPAGSIVRVIALDD